MAEATLELDLEALESHLHDDGSHDDSLPLIDPAHLDAPTQPLKGPAYRKEDKVDEHVVDVDEDEDSVDLSRPLVPPKRPMAGFFLYINEKRASFKQEHPDAGVAEITKQLSAQWQGMTEEEQKPYMEKAAEAKIAYQLALARYNRLKERHATYILNGGRVEGSTGEDGEDDGLPEALILPLARVRKLMVADESVKNVSKEAVQLTTRATEAFIEHMAGLMTQYASRAGTRSIKADFFQVALRADPALFFLARCPFVIGPSTDTTGANDKHRGIKKAFVKQGDKGGEDMTFMAEDDEGGSEQGAATRGQPRVIFDLFTKEDGEASADEGERGGFTFDDVEEMDDVWVRKSQSSNTSKSAAGRGKRRRAADEDEDDPIAGSDEEGEHKDYEEEEEGEDDLKAGTGKRKNQIREKKRGNRSSTRTKGDTEDIRKREKRGKGKTRHDEGEKGEDDESSNDKAKKSTDIFQMLAKAKVLREDGGSGAENDVDDENYLWGEKSEEEEDEEEGGTKGKKKRTRSKASTNVKRKTTDASGRRLTARQRRYQHSDDEDEILDTRKSARKSAPNDGEHEEERVNDSGKEDDDEVVLVGKKRGRSQSKTRKRVAVLAMNEDEGNDDDVGNEDVSKKEDDESSRKILKRRRRVMNDDDEEEITENGKKDAKEIVEDGDNYDDKEHQEPKKKRRRVVDNGQDDGDEYNSTDHAKGDMKASPIKTSWIKDKKSSTTTKEKKAKRKVTEDSEEEEEDMNQTIAMNGEDHVEDAEKSKQKKKSKGTDRREGLKERVAAQFEAFMNKKSRPSTDSSSIPMMND